MIKTKSLCACGSGKPTESCCRKGLQITSLMMPIASPKERQELLMDLAISKQFDMAYRGLLEYYGKELIAYKREKPIDKIRNEFLRVFSRFITYHLNDNCPPSWKECQPSFWEEFIYTCLPHYIKITPQENQIQTFLFQLKKYVRWLDKRVGTSCYNIVEKMAEEAEADLKSCERLLNHLFLISFPLIHKPNWDLTSDYEKLEQKFNQFEDRLSSIFEITSIIEKTVVLTEFETNVTYYVNGFPCHLIVPGMIINGSIGKRKRERVWEWYETESVYPQIGGKYIKLVNKFEKSL